MSKAQWLLALLESNTPEEMEEKVKKHKKPCKPGDMRKKCRGAWPYPFWWGRGLIFGRGRSEPHQDHGHGHFPHGSEVPHSHGGDGHMDGPHSGGTGGNAPSGVSAPGGNSGGAAPSGGAGAPSGGGT